MTSSRGHPWPTDGVTKRQLDRQVDRLERLHELNLKKIRRAALASRLLEGRILVLEQALMAAQSVLEHPDKTELLRGAGPAKGP